MGNTILAMLLVGILILAGCASQQPPPQSPPASPPPAPPQTQPNNTTAEPPPALPETPPAMEAEKCTVEFQKDSSSVYYVMVKTDSKKTLEVTCPSGKQAEKRGGLYFCTELDIPSPAIAKLDGVECGRADFNRKSAEVRGTGQ